MGSTECGFQRIGPEWDPDDEAGAMAMRYRNGVGDFSDDGCRVGEGLREGPTDWRH